MSSERLGNEHGLQEGDLMGRGGFVSMNPDLQRVSSDLKWRNRRANALAQEVKQLLAQDSDLPALSVKVAVKSQHYTVLVQGFDASYMLAEAIGLTIQRHFKSHKVIVRVSPGQKEYELILELGGFGLDLPKN